MKQKYTPDMATLLRVADPARRREERRKALEDAQRPTPPDFVQRYQPVQDDGEAPAAAAPAEERTVTKGAPAKARRLLPWKAAASFALIAVALALVGAIVLLGQARDASRKAESMVASAKAAATAPNGVAAPATGPGAAPLPSAAASASTSTAPSATAVPSQTTPTGAPLIHRPRKEAHGGSDDRSPSTPPPVKTAAPAATATPTATAIVPPPPPPKPEIID
jgi:hypothetical protein